jgi:hypothetical protein
MHAKAVEMQAKIKNQQKKTIKQSMLSPTRHGCPQWSRHSVARQNPRGVRWRLFIICVLLGSLESPPSIMVTRNLWSARVWVRDWLCKGKTHHPQCTLPKVSCIVVWLFFSRSSFYSLVFSKVQGRSPFVKESLPYWVKS